MLEYDEASAQNPNPSISLRITEPDDEEEKNWKVKMVSGIPVSYNTFPHFLMYSFTLLLPLCICVFVCYMYSLRNQLWIS